MSNLIHAVITTPMYLHPFNIGAIVDVELFDKKCDYYIVRKVNGVLVNTAFLLTGDEFKVLSSRKPLKEKCYEDTCS